MIEKTPYRNKLKGMEAQTSKGIIFIVAQDIVSAN